MKARIALVGPVIALALSLSAFAQSVVSPPFITPGDGSYFDSVDVAIFTATVGATIYYTTDGSDPDPTDLEATQPFTFPFTLTDPTTVKAIAVKEGDTDSAISTAVFDISPTPEILTPTVTISGKKSLKTTKAKIKIRGTATDAIEVDYQVGVDGDFKIASGTTAWSFTAKLKPGKNVIYVYAIGEEEDSDPAKITVTLVKKK
jgi:hypothetical protein